MQAVLFRNEILQYVLVLCVIGRAECVTVALLIVTASNITAGHRIRAGIDMFLFTVVQRQPEP